jgi:GTP 3',8-cyclase
MFKVSHSIVKNGKWLKTKPHKLFHHLDRVRQWMEGEPMFPVFVELGPTNRCNQRCPWCYTQYTHGDLSFDQDLFLRIISDLHEAGVRSVCVQGTGEPFMNPYSADAIALGGKLGIEMATITNGVLLTEKAAEKAIPHLKWAKISAVEGSPELYAANHGTSERQYSRLIKNIESIVKLNQGIPGSEFVLSAAMLVCENNWHTVADVVKLTSDLGFDFIQVRAPSGSLKIDYKTTADLHKKDEVQRIIDKASSYNRATFLVDIRIDSFEDQNKGPFPKDFDTCYGMEFETLIDADAKVYPCLRFWGDEEYALGDLRKSSFREIWSGERKKQIFNRIWNEWDLDQCHMVCKQSYINSSLWELKHPPLHKSFL